MSFYYLTLNTLFTLNVMDTIEIFKFRICSRTFFFIVGAFNANPKALK